MDPLNETVAGKGPASPRVSVVLPVYNAERFVGEAIDSILGQTLADFELIVIDDGSSDQSPGILADRAGRDRRIRLIARENRGLASSLNEGLADALSPLVAIMNADDVALPDRLAKQAAFLDAHPAVAVVGSQTQFLATDAIAAPATRLPQSPTAVRRFLGTASPFAHPAVMFRRQAVLDAGLYRPQVTPAEDYDLWLRLADRADLANLPEVLLHYRLHPAQMTANRDEGFAVATLVVQAASRERRAGRPDPVDGVSSLSSELLARLGIRQSDVARQMLTTALSRAETLLSVTGSAEQALDQLASLKGHWAARNQSRLWAGCNRWLKARIALRQGRPMRAGLELAAAMAADFSFTRRLANAFTRRVAPSF